MKPFSIIIFISVITLFWAHGASASEDFSSWRTEAIRLVNADREAHGLRALDTDAMLDAAAASKLSDMERVGYFAHTSPSGVSPWAWIERAGYGYRFAGENLAIRFTNARDEHAAWMDSEKHCQNILDPRFRDIGMATRNISFDGNDVMLTVSMFGTKVDEKSGSIGTKEDALAMCRGTLPAVLGGTTSGSGMLIGGWLLSNLDTVSWKNMRVAQIVALACFALAQMGAVAFTALALFRKREWRDGIFAS
jgi:hypothetical protein